MDAATATVSDTCMATRTDSPCVWVLPHCPESAGAARRMTLSVLPEWGIDSDTADQVLLVVSELVTNAVEHANPPVTLHLDRPTLDGTLHIEVDDGGPAAQDGIWARSCTPEERGRGYAVIDLLATAHGIRALTCGATHWADLPAA